jgi:hypothetical protein
VALQLTKPHLQIHDFDGVLSLEEEAHDQAQALRPSVQP